MATYREIIGKKIKKVSSDPSSGTEGEMWYNSTTGTLRGPAITSAWSSGANQTTFREGSTAVMGTTTAGLIAGGSSPSAPYTNKTEEYNGAGWAAGGNLGWSPTPDPNKGASGNTPGAGGNGRAVPAFPGPVVAPGITIVTPGAPNPFATVVGPTGIYAGGGAGGLFTPRSPGNTASSGGTGGGGNSYSTGSYPPSGNATGGAGVSGCGGGGGGSGREEVTGGVGGHGVVMIRYSA